MEDVALNAAMENARDTARAEPTISTGLWQQIERNETKKKRSASNHLCRGAKRQRAAHLSEKYGGLKTRDGK